MLIQIVEHRLACWLQETSEEFDGLGYKKRGIFVLMDGWNGERRKLVKTLILILQFNFSQLYLLVIRTVFQTRECCWYIPIRCIEETTHIIIVSLDIQISYNLLEENKRKVNSLSKLYRNRRNGNQLARLISKWFIKFSLNYGHV